MSGATLVVEKRLKEASASAYTQDVDVMIDAEIRRQKTDFVRTSMKKSIRTYTYKLLNKAEANIEAVGKGTFGVGIYPNKSKNSAAKKFSGIKICTKQHSRILTIPSVKMTDVERSLIMLSKRVGCCSSNNQIILNLINL
jgi:hypothetical protein